MISEVKLHVLYDTVKKYGRTDSLEDLAKKSGVSLSTIKNNKNKIINDPFFIHSMGERKSHILEWNENPEESKNKSDRQYPPARESLSHLEAE